MPTLALTVARGLSAMCGIFGGINSNYQPSHLETIKHRGPDNSGFFARGGTVLGHTRLSIQDLSEAGAQPMLSEDERFAITYNGEIYNVEELRKVLIRKGYNFRGHSDTEVLLNLYIEFGEECLLKLNGIFAFAIWDELNRTLFLAKDRFGVKPLYYEDTPNGFVFASEIKSILAQRKEAPEVNADAVAMHLTYLWCPSPNTIVKDIYKLSPGEAIVVGMNGIKRKWRYKTRAYNGEISSISVNDAIDETRRLLDQAVQRQLISDIPVGCFLSGGLDSSALTAFASKNTSEKLQAFTISLKDDFEASEGAVADLPYAKLVAEKLGVNLNVLEVDSSIIKHFDDMVFHLDEPLADPAALNVGLISESARANGINVLLSGTGGDDIFSGYRRHYALNHQGLWDWIPTPIRKVLSAQFQTNKGQSHIARRLSKLLRNAHLEGDELLISYFQWLSPEKVNPLLANDTNEGRDLSFYFAPMLETLSHIPDEKSNLNRMLYLEQEHFLADHNLLYSDKMSMAHGVEVRVPFLDNDLVDFASTLPTSFKQKGHCGKWILKKAMENILPHDVIYRPKSGFAAPLRKWIKEDLSDLADELLSEESIKSRGLFNFASVNNLRKQNQGNAVDAAYPIFSIMCIEQWCRRFIDRRVSSSQ